MQTSFFRSQCRNNLAAKIIFYIPGDPVEVFSGGRKCESKDYISSGTIHELTERAVTVNVTCDTSLPVESEVTVRYNLSPVSTERTIDTLKSLKDSDYHIGVGATHLLGVIFEAAPLKQPVQLKPINFFNGKKIL